MSPFDPKRVRRRLRRCLSLVDGLLPFLRGTSSTTPLRPLPSSPSSSSSSTPASTSTSATPRSAHLMTTLPAELITEICQHLDRQSLVALQLSSRRLYLTARPTSPPPLTTDTQVAALLAALRDWDAVPETWLACHHCCTYRPRWAFSAKQRYTRRAEQVAKRRCCLQCGADRGIYAPRADVLVAAIHRRQRAYLCPVCRTIDAARPAWRCDECARCFGCLERIRGLDIVEDEDVLGCLACTAERAWLKSITLGPLWTSGQG
ncbi:MAG: hypothetical protein M1833_000689 [Piccolia ochrophora]|nr:MAG: hypothetical protein M1833_000689 [Piccolia ochrophora]